MAEQEATPAARSGHPIGRWVGPIVLTTVGVVGASGSLVLGIADGAQPGPGLWPLIVSAVVFICAIAMGPQDDVESVTLRELRVVATALLLLGLFCWLFTLMGIFVPSLVVLFVWLKLLSRRGWIFSAITAVATAAGLYVVFTYVFGVGA